MNLAYDVEADWTLLGTCSFRCSYCFSSDTTRSAKIRVHASAEQWSSGFDATGKTWLLHVNGGEPSLYPDFPELCRRLSQKHYLSINSNLTGPGIEELAQTVDPRRVHFINAALHIAERDRRHGFERFVERVQTLQRHGFAVLLSVLMTPATIRRYPEISARLAAHGLAPLPKVMRGRFEGKVYPHAYSRDERSRFLGYLAEARQAYAPLWVRMGERPTVDLFMDDRFLEDVPYQFGKRCGMGHNLVTIDSAGNVDTCSERSSLGSILAKTVRLLPRPRLCTTGCYVPYFCEKYTAPAFVGPQSLANLAIHGVATLARGAYRIARRPADEAQRQR